MLETRQLSVSLGGREVIHGIDCTAQPGEVLGLIGPNGSGKSTLLKAMAGLLRPSAGGVWLEGEPLAALAPRQRARRLGYLPQNAECHWPLTVERVTALGRLPWGGGESPEDRAWIEKALCETDALPLRDRVITELSGGERARVFLARALAGDPALLLADEPGTGLDPLHQLRLMERLAARAAEGKAVLIALHDLGLAARFCHRLLLLKEGRLLASGTPGEVLTDARLAQAHGIRAFRSHNGAAPVLVPWEGIAEGEAPPAVIPPGER